MADARPSFDTVTRAFGVAATVSPTGGGAAIATTVVWMPVQTEENPSGGEHRSAERFRVIAVPGKDVPVLPRGSVIVAPLVEGGALESWTVDETRRLSEDHHRAVVVHTPL